MLRGGNWVDELFKVIVIFRIAIIDFGLATRRRKDRFVPL